MFGLGCRKARGRIAASIYEPLPEQERKALARHTARCVSCRREAESMARVAALVPRNRPEPGFDLVPLLRRRLAEDEAPRSVEWRRPALATAAIAVCGALAVFYALRPEGAPDSPVSVASTQPASAVGAALAKAEQLASARDYAGAYAVLEKAVDQAPADPRAGDAQLQLADLAFSHLRMYDLADEAYVKLVSAYPDTVKSEGATYEVALRRNLLAEGQSDNYHALRALDAARRDPANAMARYEAVIAHNPTALAASQALEEMVAIAAPESAGDPNARMAAMESVRGQLKSPDAVAKLNLEIGNLAWHQLGDLVVARESFQQAATSTNAVLAQRARESLDELARATR